MKYFPQLVRLLLISAVLHACVNTTPPAKQTVATTIPAKHGPIPIDTNIPSAAMQTSHMTFTLTGEQAQEVAVLMDFIRAYNNEQLDDALALLAETVKGSDCDYQAVKVILFHGKPQAAERLRNRFADHDRLEVRQIYNQNPDSSGKHVIEVVYARRSSRTLTELGFESGITPKLASKVVFSVAPTLIEVFSNAPYGGDVNLFSPGN